MKKIMMLLAFIGLVGMQAFAQTTVTGEVTGPDGTTIPGVTIRPKGNQSVGTITDIDGKYTLNVPAGFNTLVFSYTGMKHKEMPISGSVINIAMETDDIGLDEVIVTAVGISRDKKALGYSVQSVSSEELTKSANADVVNSLSAKTAGVQINSSGGTAGASTYITIRGAASLSGNNQPLFVVDGIPISSGEGGGGSTYDTEGVGASSRTIDINPDDIETLTVLKGGAATALYGLQAANGAIVITTKKGKAGQKMEVNFHSSVAIDQLSQVPEMQQKYAQGNNGEWMGGFSQSWGPEIANMEYDGDETYIWDPNGNLVPAGTGNGKPAQAYDQFDFFQTGITHNNNVSISAGNDKSTYYFSVGNMTQEGVIPNNEFSRTSIRLNATTKLTDKLSTGASMSYVHSDGNFIQQGSNVSGVMLGLLRTPPTFDNSAGYRFADGTQRNYRNGGGYDNPYWTANMNSFDDRVDRFIGNLNLNYALAEWINITYKIGTDWYSRSFQDVFAVGSRQNTAGYIEEYSQFKQIINSDLLINISKDFSDDFRTRITLGQNMYQESGKSMNGIANGLSIPEFYQLNNTTDQTTAKGEYKYRTAAFFGDFQADYNNMLFVGITGRAEWATTMPEDNLVSFYPSVNTGFIFTEIPGLKDNATLSFGKLRASWSKTANIAGPYSTVTTYNAASTGDGWTGGNSFPFLGYSGYAVGYLLGNSDLKHESMTTFEVGAELKFWLNRFSIDVAYFKNENADLLMQVPVATSSGYDNVYMNAGTMESEGIELMIGATPIKFNGIEWNINVNFTQLKNPVTELAEGVENLFLGGFTDPQIRAVEGMEYRSIFGYDWYRDEQGRVLLNDDPTDGYPDGFPMTDEREMISLGTVNPDWTANIGNTVSYKGLSFSFLFDIKKGGKMYNGTRFTMNTFGTSMETIDRDVTYNGNGTINFTETPSQNVVVYEGVFGHLDGDDNPVSNGVTNTAQVVNDQDWFQGQGGNFGGGATAAAIEDAGWVRLREVSIAYKLPKTLLSKTFIKNASIYATGRNLWVRTAYSGIDPETSLTGATNGQGMDYFNMPGTKAYIFGVKLTF